jgi:Arc/MetJ-type ribon-helix-helix transcriptional regulator
MTEHIAERYAQRMPQLVTRVDATLIDGVDELIAAGVVETRSDAVRLGLERLIDRHRRDEIGRQIVAGYVRTPQTEEEVSWADAAAAKMIAEEPW